MRESNGSILGNIRSQFEKEDFEPKLNISKIVPI